MDLFVKTQRSFSRLSSNGFGGFRFRVLSGLLAGALAAAYALAQTGTHPFTNGFEGDSLGDWVIESEALPGEVVVVGPEGPADFPVYSDIGVSEVTPNRGDYMLRMGTPKSSNETQPRGINRIAQTFTGSDHINLALWIFSLEHRGDDILRIHLVDQTDGNKEILSSTGFSFSNGTGCKANALCEQVIDVGKRNKVYINSGWRTMSFTGIDPAHTYKITIELEAGQNESLASWLYVDSINEPPVPAIRFSPAEPVEGDFVVFDCLTSGNPDGDNQTCDWKINGTTAETLSGPTVAYWAPNDGYITVELTVSDGDTSVTTSLDSPGVYVKDKPPLMNALDVEVLPGGSVDLVCRYVDPGLGADDTHELSFNVADGAVSDLTQTPPENKAALSTGLARATFNAEGLLPSLTPIAGSCTTDGGSADFTITIVSPGELAEDIATNNRPSIAGAPPLLADHSSLGGLTDPSTVAVYQLFDSDGNPFPAGAEVLVTAHFPVDYDIALLSGSFDETVDPKIWASAPFVSVPFVSVPFVSVPFVSVPFVSVPFVSVPFVSVPFVSVPFITPPFVSAPLADPRLTQSIWDIYNFAFENFPLTQLAGAPDGSNISGLDISFGDLGALNSVPLVDDPVFLKGLSAEFGTNTEQVLVKIGPGEKGLYLAVIPQTGSESTAPYNIEVEAYIPVPTAKLLETTAVCQGTPLVSSPTATTEVLGGYTGSKTLVVTQRERMAATFFNGDVAAFDAWLTSPPMHDFFTDPKVSATVISVPSNLYTTADEKPCEVAQQIALAEDIKSEIDTYRAAHPELAVEYIQLMGSLDIIPPYFVPDETQTGNESLFASDLLTRLGTPLSIAVSEGYMLTDAFYADAVPQPFNARQLYLEDISVSRMVETPDEIQANAQRFVDTNGVINLYSVAMATGAGTISTGYDFFVDGTDRIIDILSGLPGNHKTRNDTTWSADDLRCLFFGKGCPADNPNSVSALNTVNAHMSYNAALSAKGFYCEYQDQSACPEGVANEAVFSGESAGIYDDADGDGPAITINGVTFSIGCHSALSVPDAWGLPEELGLPVDTASDWVQELGTWVGSYNFAYGDTDVADRGTEGIMPLVIENFTKGMPLGQALVLAKQQYAMGLFEFGVYDEKSLVGLNLFGMPQATLEVTSPAPSASAASALFATSASSATADPVGTLNIDYIENSATSQFSGTIYRHTNPNKGEWYSVDRDAQAILGRPLLPIVEPFQPPLRAVTGTTVHGVALRGGTFTNYLSRDPVFPAQTHDLVTSIGEPQPCVETLSPTLVALVNRFTAGPGDLGKESFIVQPGQFRCQPEASGSVVIGDFRIWNTMTLELLHPEGNALDSDLKPPVVTQQDLLGDPDTRDVNVTLTAEDDDSGIREIIALVYSDDGLDGGTGMAQAYSTKAPAGASGWPSPFTAQMTLPDAYDKLLAFQYIDGAGNITAKTLKGALMRAIDVSIKTSIINGDGVTIIKVEIQDFCSLSDPYLIIDFGDVDENGDANIERYDLEDPDCANEQPPASSTFEFSHLYGEISGTVTVKVEVRAVGAVGTDEKVLSACSDPVDEAFAADSDIVACSVSSVGTQLTLDVIMRGPISDTIQYRLNLPETNTQIKYSAGAVTGPKKLKPLNGSDDGERTVTFTFDAARLGWDGMSPIQFQFETQDGVSGGQGQGFVDQTDVKIYAP